MAALTLPPFWANSCLNLIGYENVTVDFFSSVANVTAGTAQLALDERPYTAWAPGTGTQSFEVIFTTAKDVDYIALYNHKLAGGTLTVQWSPDLTTAFAALTSLATDGPAPKLLTFTSVAARRLKFILSGGAAQQLAVVMAGRRLYIPMQDVGWTPPRLARKVERTANVSASGVFLGASILRAANPFDIKATFLKLDWAYSEWLAFIRHAENRPFFFDWSITEGGDTAFCWVEDDIPPPAFVTNVAVDASVPVVGVLA